MNTRRALTLCSTAAVAVLALTACAPTPTGAGAAGPDALTVFVSGDTNVQDLWEKALIPAFEKANPGTQVTTTIDLHGEHDQQTLAKLATSVQAGAAPGFDLVDAGFVTSAGKAGLLAEASTANEPNLAHVTPAAVTAGGGFGIPYRASSVLLAYDTKTVTAPPKTLDALLGWIRQNPGRFTYNTPSTGGSGGAFVTTVLDKYVPAADRQQMTTGHATAVEGDWAQGFAELKSLNPFVYQKGVYPNGNNQVLDLLGRGAISMAPVWSDQVITAQKSGTIPPTVAFTQISDPSFTGSASYLGIPKSGAHVAEAQKLADFVLSPPAQQIISDAIAGYPVIALDTLPPAVAATFTAADPGTLRPGYQSATTQDMNNQWDQKVPGQ